MRHVDQPTLDDIINHRLSPRDLARLKDHVRACPLCSRRLEEYRDVFSEVESIIPTLERDIVHDLEPRSWRRILMPRLDNALPRGDRMLWGVVAAAAVATAAVVAMLLSSPALPPGPVPVEPRTPAPPPAAGQAAPPAAPATAGVSAPSPGTAPPASSPTPPHHAPGPASLAGSGFHRVESAEAIRALGGAIRLIDGLLPDHFEMGVGTRLPGAVDSLPIVRVVYRDGGSVVLLDEQRRPGPAPGDTLVGTADAGVSVLQWNSNGFWLSLAGRLPVDSLEGLARRIR